MKKQIKSTAEKKNSTPVVNQPVTDVKITENTVCVVNFVLAGSFADRQSNASTKEEIRRMQTSPFLDENKKGRFICAGYGLPGRKLKPEEKLPKNFYLGQKDYKPCRYHKCYERRVYNSDALAYLSSLDGKPYQIGKKQWEGMTVCERLQLQFSIDACSMNSINPGFTFEFIS